MSFRFTTLLIALFLHNSLLYSAMTDTEGMKPLTLLADKKLPVIKNGKKSLPLKVRNHSGVNRTSTAVRGGIPFAENDLFEISELVLHDSKGNLVNADYKVLSRWWNFKDPAAKVSVKWLLVTFPASVKADSEEIFTLEYGKTASLPAGKKLAVETGNKVIIETDIISAEFEKSPSAGLKQIYLKSAGKKTPLLKKPLHVFAELNYKMPEPEHRWVCLKKLGSGSWLFKTDPEKNGNEKNWHSAEFKPAGWGKADPFYPWENQGYEYYDGTAWYRASFRADEKWKGRPVYFEMRQARHHQTQQVKIYLNGELLDTMQGGILASDRLKRNLQLRVLLPEDLLKNDSDNIIAVEVNDGGAGESGLICNPVISTRHNSELDGEWLDRSGSYSSLNYKKTKLELIDNGTFSSCVKLSGKTASEKGYELIDYSLYLRFYKNSGRIDTSFTYTQAENPACYLYKSIGVDFPAELKGRGRLFCSPEAEEKSEALKIDNYSGEKISLHQFHDGKHRYPGFPTLKEHPLQLKFTVKNKSADKLLGEGKKTAGSLSWTGSDYSASMYSRDFWQAYPSEISMANESLRFYFWPESGREMDMRHWYVRRDGGFEELCKLKGRDVSKDSGLGHNYINSAEHLPTYNSVGCSWTKNFRLEFKAAKNTVEAAASQAVDFQDPILPFVSAKYNCETAAFGMPVHPRDTVNYPKLELYTDAKLEFNRWLQWDELAIYGMWYWGAMRYEYVSKEEIYKEYEKRKRLRKLSWDRRWFHHERGISPAMSYWTQYFRTGDIKHLNSARIMSRFGSRVLIRTEHPAPKSTGYAMKHRVEAISYGNPSHTNLQAIAVDYFLTGDEFTGRFLKKLEKLYARERMVNFGGHTGEYTFHRGHDAALTCRAILWFVNGSIEMRDWVEHGLKYFKKMEEKGFTCYRPSYHIDQLTRTWYYTRHPLALENHAKPLQVFVDNSKKGVFNSHTFALKKYGIELRKITSFWNDPDVMKKIYKHTSNARHSLPVPDFDVGLLQAALYKCGFPVYDFERVHNKSLFSRYWISKDHALPLTKGFRYEPLDLRAVVNENPYKAMPKKLRMVEGEYCLNKGTLPDYRAKLADNEIGFDFGPYDSHQAGWKRAYGSSVYPTIASYEHAENLSGLPFGLVFKKMNVTFGFIDPDTNDGKAIYKSRKGDEFTLPIGKNTAQIAFAGHIQQDALDFSALKGMEYELQYADGSNKVFEVKPGIHYDDWREDRAASNVVTTERARSFIHHPGERYSLHFNIFLVNPDPARVLESIKVKSFTDGFILMAVSAEVKGEKETDNSKEIYSFKTSGKAIKPFEELKHKTANGWYNITIRLQEKQKQFQNPISIVAEDEIIAAGLVYKLHWRKPELTFPVEINDGELNLKILRSAISEKASCFDWVKVTQLTEPVKFKTPRRKFNIKDVHGLAFHNLHEQRDCLVDYPARDNVTSDWVNIMKNSFTTHLANGSYEVELLLFAALGEKAYSVTINGKEQKIKLPSQQVFYPAPFEHKPYEVLKDKVQVTDGKLFIKFGKTYRNQSVGIRGMRIKRITNSE
ncbi:MAG: beta galactosidase jelly roll domain-containing protein [Planctomycetota bacterium]|jgi:hypothetical protein